MTRVVLDIECDSLTPTVIHCIVTEDIDTGDVKTYTQQEFDTFRRASNDYTLVIGHHILGYDLPALAKIIDWHTTATIHDTLIISKLLKYNIEGGHSLEAWGSRLKHPKVNFNEFSTFTQEMLDYCINDVKLNTKLYKFLMQRMPHDKFGKAIEVEHEVQRLLNETKINGFPFNMEKMSELRKEISERVEELDKQILSIFPPKYYSLGEYIPRLTKHGTISRSNLRWYADTDYSVFCADCPFTRLGVEYFNPGSTKQIVTRLTDNGWWDPTDRTDGYTGAKRARDHIKIEKLDKYGWKINETNLATLKPDAPEQAKLLVERLALGSRLLTFTQWDKAYNASTRSIHGTINGIGTWTHRCSHTDPNLANIAAKKSIKYKEPVLAAKITSLGGRMRDLFHCGDDANSYLVGTDAEGIQLRLFAHYTNDPSLIKANVDGRKELGTDIHTLNQRALGEVCRTRDDAKTWIYAYLLGAGGPKLATILGCTRGQAAEALANLLSTYSSITELRGSQIPRDAARGYFEGIDGRLVCCDSEHHMLAGYLQNGEVLVMKHAMMRWHNDLGRHINYRLVNFVHDEWQTIVTGTREEADKVAQAQRDAISWAGRELGVRCPLAGSSTIGHTWLDTH